MTKHTDFAELLQPAQHFDARQGIFGKVLRGSSLHTACRFTHATIIETQGGDAVSGQIVGNDEKGLVVEDLFIAILCTAARYHNQHRNLIALLESFGIDKSACKTSVSSLILKGYFLGLIGIRLYGMLRAIVLHLPGLHIEGQIHSHLREGAFQLAFVQFSCIRHADAWHCNVHRVSRDEIQRGGNSFGTLVGAVHGAHILSAGILIEMQHDCQLLCT